MWDDITREPVPEHVAAVVALALSAAPRCGDTVIVALDGPSGSGKTTLAHGVAAALRAAGTTDPADPADSADEVGGVDTVGLVHMDHLYPGWHGLARAPGLLTTQVLEPLAQGRPASFRLWSWVRDEWRGRRVVPPARFLVVEGCGSSVEPAGSYAAVRVFLDADSDLRRERGLARDGEAYRPRWQLWADQERELFERDDTRRRADLVIDTSRV